MNLVVPSPCETRPYNKAHYYLFNPFNNMDPLSETDVIQIRGRVPRILWQSLKYCPLTRNERATKLRTTDLGRDVALKTGMLLFKLTFFPHQLHLNSNSSTVFCFTEQNSNSVSFSQSKCCRLLKVLLSRFSSEVDVVLIRRSTCQKFRARLYY